MAKVIIRVVDEGNGSLASFVIDFTPNGIKEQVEFYVENCLDSALMSGGTVRTELNNLNLAINGVKLERNKNL